MHPRSEDFSVGGKKWSIYRGGSPDDGNDAPEVRVAGNKKERIRERRSEKVISRADWGKKYAGKNA